MIALMRRILTVSGKYKGRIQLAFVFSFLKSFLAKAPIGLGFFALAAFYNGTASPDMCLWIGIAMAGSVLLQVLFHHIADRLQSAAGFMVFAEKRMELGAHLRKMPMGYFTEGNIGKISSVLSTDMVFIEENCMMVLADMMSYIFAEAILLVFMLFFNVWLGFAGIVILLIILPVARGMKKESLVDSAIRQEQSENLTESVLDFTEGIGIIKTYNLMGEKSKELSDNFRESCRISIQFEENHSPWQRWLNILYGFGAVVIIALSAYLNSRGLMDVTFFVGIMLFVFDLFGPLKALYSQSARLTVMNSCMDRIEAVFAEHELPDNGQNSIPEASQSPEVEFRNVSFAYGDKDVLHNVSFDLNRNSMLALVGPSGGGKSTIASLLTRFWDVKSGQILIRGKDVREVQLSDLMNHISMVFQRVYLFQDTIYNNISMGRPDASEAEVLEAAKKARCYDFIMALPEGFQTMVGEGGETLSGGEKQRISIARCILKDAPIVILDEATASVDADNESYIQQAISELCKGKTLLVIAHRLNTIRSADKILVIADGKIAQKGTHDELMNAGGIYRDFVNVRQNSRGWSRRNAV
ncbi:putative multidrug export ATP-binding/permease protein [Anaerotignum neopropionicum]|uniref:Putative multidrug export ATP-binding/permease protein n=1 Tax=Anaerotignum neopropionicum TaxID=36847 RepID=A0A136WDB1_9FIRM|nr:ABC transporter ATP-binding protein [Anaerotignum neopropionicum]KXL52505.1 putative multidrug export ATP-binding/permease protein [Anaerotignum neopropionicum]